jgi:PAS domain S-box-containing protein
MKEDDQRSIPVLSPIKRSLAFVFCSMLLLMFVFESAKQVLNPEITVWESHAVTILFTTLLAMIIVFILLLRIASEQENARIAQAALRKNEEKFRAIADFTYDWEYWIAPDGRYVYMTPSVEKITGYSAREFYERPALFDEIIYQEDRAGYRRHMDISQVSDKPESVEYRIVRKDGEIRWIGHICQPMYGSGGELLGRRSSNRDITDRRRAEEALKANETRFREERDRLDLILRTAQDGFWLVDAPTGRLIEVNDAACAMLGYTKEELLARGIADIDAQWSPDELAREIRKTTLAGSAQFETRQRTRDGRIIDVEISVNYLQATGQFFAFIHDITRRNMAEKEIRLSFERFRTVMDSIDALVYVADMETYELLFLNKYGREIWGDTGKKTCWQTLQEGQEGPCAFCTNSRLVDAGGRPTGTYVWEFRNTKNGRWYECRDSAIHWVDGRLVRLEVATDITDRKKVEEVIRKSEERIRANEMRLANAMDLAHLVNWEFDVRTGIFSFDKRFYALYGTTPEKEGGTLMPAEVYAREFVHPDDAERVARVISEALKITDPSHSVQLEHRIIRRDGQVRHIVVRFSPVMDENGILIRTFGANQDITERKVAEEALRESEEKFRVIFNSIGDAVFIQSVNGNGLPLRNLAVNTTACSMFGYSCDDLLKTDPMRLVAGISRSTDDIGRDMASEGYAVFETTILLKDGSVIPVEINTHAGTLAGENVIVSVVRDITERKKAEEALRESEEKFRSIFNNANDAIEIMEIRENGLPGRFLDLNDVACRMLGFTKEELLQMGPFEISTDYFSRSHDEISRDIHTTGITKYETEHRKKDGTIVPVEVNSHTLTLLGKPVLLAIARDITERKRAEQALQESRRRLSDIIDFLPDPTFVISREGRVIAWNRAIGNLTGVEAGDILGKTDYEYAFRLFGERRPLLIDLVIRPDPEEIRQHYSLVRKEGEMLTGQFHVASLRGRPADLWIIATPLFDSKGEISGAIESIRDITDIKNTERELANLNRTLEQRVKERTQELEEAQNHTRSLIEADLDPLVLIGTDGIIMDVNSAAEKMTGLGRDVLKGTPFSSYIVEKEKARAGFEAVIRLGTVTGNRYSILNKDGSDTPVIVSAALVRDHAGAPAGVFASIHDITRILQDEEVITTQLRENEVLLREVHHRVKNNLQIIVSLISLQMRSLSDQKALGALQDTQNRVRAISIVHERLHMAKELGTIDFGAYLRFLGSSLLSFYQKNPADIRLVIDVEGIILDIDTASPLGLVFNELISNMLKYAFPDGRKGECVIAARPEGQSLVLTMQDNGVGIPADLDWNNSPTLGLRLVNILVAQLKGKIDLDRTAGTKFVITIPVPEKATGIHHVGGL